MPEEQDTPKQPPGENIVLEENKQGSSNPQSLNESAKMEIVHHSHTPRKKWKHYVFEFVMLFLAVFFGFLAQWQLEQTIEHQREKEFMHSMIEDLKKDSARLIQYIHFNEYVLKYCDSLQLCIATTDVFKNSNNLYNYSRVLAHYMRYYSTDRTIQQLKNAGSMRLIRKWDVSNAITDYDSETKKLTETDQQLNEQIVKYREYLIEFLDLSSYDKLNPAGSFMEDNIRTKGNPGYITIDPKKLKIIYNQAFTLKIFLSTVQKSAVEVDGEAKQLLDLIQKEYID